MKKVLQKIGLSGQEAGIYLALLKTGACSVNKIVDKTKINRTTIYDRLNKLVERGLVSYIVKNKIKYFSAAEPKKILHYLEDKHTKLNEQKESILNILPNLEKIKPSGKEEIIEVFEGREGLKTILDDILKSKKDILTYGSLGNFSNVLKFYFKNYLRRLEESKIKMKVIFNYADEKKFINKLTEVRYLPKEYETPTETTIYGNKLVLFLFKDKPKGILIKSKIISDAYKKYFDILWQKAKKDTVSSIPSKAKKAVKKSIKKPKPAKSGENLYT